MRRRQIYRLSRNSTGIFISSKGKPNPAGSIPSSPNLAISRVQVPTAEETRQTQATATLVQGSKL